MIVSDAFFLCAIILKCRFWRELIHKTLARFLSALFSFLLDLDELVSRDKLVAFPYSHSFLAIKLSTFFC